MAEFCSIDLIIHCTDFKSSSTFVMLETLERYKKRNTLQTSQFERSGESVVHEWLPGGRHVQLEIDQTIQ